MYSLALATVDQTDKATGTACRREAQDLVHLHSSRAHHCAGRKISGCREPCEERAWTPCERCAATAHLVQRALNQVEIQFATRRADSGQVSDELRRAELAEDREPTLELAAGRKSGPAAP